MDSNTTVPLNFPLGERNKVHHSYIWLGSLVAFGAVLLVGVFSNIDDLVRLVFYLGHNNSTMWLAFFVALLVFVLAYGVVAGIYALHYRNLRYEFGEKEFSLYSGIITKRHVHVPYARVQSVNHKQSLIQRLAGVCTIEIDTAGGASNKAVRVPYVLLGTGEAIRQDLFVHKALSTGALNAQAADSPGSYAQNPATNVVDQAAAGLGVDGLRGVFDSALVGVEPISFERSLSNSELALASFSGIGFGMLVAALAAVLALVGPALMLVGPAALLFAFPAFFGVLVFSLVVSMLVAALAYGNFSVRRRGSRIEVERGILQREFSGIDIDRIQSIIIRQSFGRRLLGYCEVSVGRISAGAENKQQSNQAKLASGALVIHPFMKIDQVEPLLGGLLPEYADRPAVNDFHGLPRVSLRRGILRRCLWRNGGFWTVVAVVVFQVCAHAVAPAASALPEYDTFLQLFDATCVALYVFCILVIAMSALSSVWWYRGSGYAMGKRFLAIRNDGLSTETVFLPRQKVQDVSTRTNPFQRRAGVATIGARTAAGVNETNTVLWDVSAHDAQAWLHWLVPRTQSAHGNVLEYRI